MIELTLSSPQLQFTQFLLERFGIEGNILTVDEARAATHATAAGGTMSFVCGRSGAHWSPRRSPL